MLTTIRYVVRIHNRGQRTRAKCGGDDDDDGVSITRTTGKVKVKEGIMNINIGD
jgi:hypothetical protein